VSCTIGFTPAADSSGAVTCKRRQPADAAGSAAHTHCPLGRQDIIFSGGRAVEHEGLVHNILCPKLNRRAWGRSRYCKALYTRATNVTIDENRSSVGQSIVRKRRQRCFRTSCIGNSCDGRSQLSILTRCVNWITARVKLFGRAARHVPRRVRVLSVFEWLL